ncbi:MAG: alpha/beta fold hydrolase [Burkholderiaceae bacterium]|nr:alpha/beta fold hydrolase [Burkholderiaceae bacterium]
MSEMRDLSASPATLEISASDGYPLRGFVWRHAADVAEARRGRPVVIVNPATSVRCRYYARFAGFLHARGFDVITYDYRGIGESRPATLKGFRASWIDWGRLDFEAVLRHANEAFPGQPVQVVAHSVGGFLIGLAPSNRLIGRVFTMGAQFAYWGDYAPKKRLGMLLKWHVAMPALAALFGYFPGKRLGWLEDTPRGVVRDWTARHPRFEDAYRRELSEAQRDQMVAGFAAMEGATLALSVSDDEYGTPAAVERLLGYFDNSATTHLHLAPADAGLAQIGHFAFFHERHEATLWPLALAWLQSGRLPADAPGRIVKPARAARPTCAPLRT